MEYGFRDSFVEFLDANVLGKTLIDGPLFFTFLMREDHIYRLWYEMVKHFGKILLFFHGASSQMAAVPNLDV
jgi:hypothetical protein